MRDIITLKNNYTIRIITSTLYFEKNTDCIFCLIFNTKNE